jgi:phosphatidylserine decarboxylase
MPAEPIRYFDRYARDLRTEQIYGERWLRFAYENPVGRLAFLGLVRRAFFSKWYGWRMSRRASHDGELAVFQIVRIMLGGVDSTRLILPFIEKYNLDVDEFAASPLGFKSFNEFFYRQLKPTARPVAAGDGVAVLPADGRHLAFPSVEAADGFYVKGAKFSLEALLADAELAREFAGGAMLISRLCPVDYHRFHFPVSGNPGESRLVNGWLYSVSPVALRRNIHYLTENKRMITRIESLHFGPVLMLEVGATNVGSIRQGYVTGRPVSKGDEKGFFAFGGSCVITLFRPGRIKFESDLLEMSRQHVETYARMGDRLGVLA